VQNILTANFCFRGVVSKGIMMDGNYCMSLALLRRSTIFGPYFVLFAARSSFSGALFKTLSTQNKSNRYAF